MNAGALSTVLSVRFSDICIRSPIVIFFEWSLVVAGLISCCKICFFSAAFFLVGVELLRFLRGDGVPVSKISLKPNYWVNKVS